MAWRERLLHIGATAAVIANGRRVRIAAQLLLLAGLVFVVLRLRSLWEEGHVNLRHLGWIWLVAAAVSAAIGVAAAGFIWLVILERLGVKTTLRWAAVVLQAQLAKYIPGSLWQYGARTALAQRQDISRRPLLISMPVELGASAAAAALVALFLLGPWGVLGAAVTVVALAGAAHTVFLGARLARLFSKLTRLAVPRQAMRAAATTTPLYFGAWLIIGLSFWLTARSLVMIPVRELPFYVGAFGAAWVAGLVAIYAPGGLGVREGLLIVLLRGRIGTADAAVVATLSRIVLTSVDLGLAGLGWLFLRRANA
jgi:uncharacterized membrane protein YbhN (UPF0104 family)